MAEMEKKQLKANIPISIYNIISENQRDYESITDALCRIILEYSQYPKIASELEKINIKLLQLTPIQSVPKAKLTDPVFQKKSNEQIIRENLKGTMNIFQIINATSISFDDCQRALHSLVQQNILEKIGDNYKQKQNR